MAVKIDIPGVGEVTADNAASEETLLAILAAVDNTSNTAKARAKDEKDSSKAQHDNTKQLKDSTKAGKEFKVGWVAVADGMVKGMKTIGLTAISMATRFAVDYANIANDPIMETANTLNQLIDAAVGVATSFTDAIPVVGKFFSALLEAAGELAKIANQMFAAQLKKNVLALQDYAKAGISFSGSFAEMQLVATKAGLGLEQFSKAVLNNRDQLNQVGSAGADAVGKLATAMGVASNDITKTNSLVGKSGRNLRDEMFKMGYTFEDQIGLFSNYMANMQAAGKLEKMSKEDIAKGTREYARDLKILADITGKDAKKAMEESQKASLMADIQAKLGPEQLDKFQKAYSAMPDQAKKGFLEFVSSGGKFIADQGTNIAMAQNDEIRKLITGSWNDMNNINLTGSDVQKRTLEQAQVAFATQKQLNAENGAAINMASRFTGAFSEAAEIINGFSAGAVRQKGAVEASAVAAENMAMTANKIADNTATLYSETQKGAIEVEKRLNENLDRYSEYLAKVQQMTQGQITDVLNGTMTASISDSISSGWDRVVSAVKSVNPFSTDSKNKSPAGAKPKNPFDTATPSSPVFAFANGGSIPAGKVGMAGEKGPELIAGPAEVLSTKSTEKLMQSVDMLASAKESASTTKDGVSVARLDEVIKQLMELVRLMRDNVSHTAKVAQNTN